MSFIVPFVSKISIYIELEQREHKALPFHANIIYFNVRYSGKFILLFLLIRMPLFDENKKIQALIF
jgi:hypothetical protein